MTLRKGNIAIMAQIIALMTMVVSLYVPHHHHEESICIGNYDCKSEKHHSHQDDCGGKASKDVCCLGGEYVDFRDAGDGYSSLSFKAYDHLAAVTDELVIGGLRYEERQTIAMLPEPPFVAPVLSAKALRSPPAC